MKYLIFAVFVLLQSHSVKSFAQETDEIIPKKDEIEQIQTIQISSSKAMDWKPYKTMLKGIDAFEANHQLAPNAQLQFILKPKDSNVPIKGTTLRIKGHTVSTPIPIAENATFVLPRDQVAADEDADIEVNRKKGSMRWAPFIRSPNLGLNQRRLGDLRLECEVWWSTGYDDIPFVLRNMLRAAGGPCKLKNFGFAVKVPKRLNTATLHSGEREEKIRIATDGMSFELAGGDRRWNDDTLIELEYAQDATEQK